MSHVVWCALYFVLLCSVDSLPGMEESSIREMILRPAEGRGPTAEGLGVARTVRATADRRRRGARGGGGC